ncbi:NADPH-dependent FMN reductase [Rhodoferax sp. U2-2l]|uniref:NADPH-dependent FMN reductase n=1 Tax=Rhodoferax sp. U2-2l TaxID=2884000 RepID=UPI001D0BB87D|nr:NADPH-dependent FMN reductase [Rhodoferax sp. U2-2l]MCB8748737.1 NADPH-dependent FMN reductase [Rhodoferax sp. U2-2l]
MSVLLIAGSPTERSRSAALLDAVAQRLQFRGVQSEKLLIRDLSPQALILADFGHPTISHAIGRVAHADVVVIATPVYKAAYSGVLKVFLDLLPQTGLQGKTVLPLATGGSPNHMLALDYALRPVLQSLGAKQILPGIYATDAQVAVTESGAYEVNADIGLRLDEAVDTLIREVLPAAKLHTKRFAPVHFSQVRCSV